MLNFTQALLGAAPSDPKEERPERCKPLPRHADVVKHAEIMSALMDANAEGTIASMRAIREQIAKSLKKKAPPKLVILKAE